MRKRLAAISPCLLAGALSTGCHAPAPTLDAEAVARYLARDASRVEGRSGEPAGLRHATRFSLTIASAEGLPDLDSGPGDSDPYVIVSVAGTRLRTSTAEGTADPVWGDTFVFEAPPEASLEATVFDADSLGDERIAVTTITLPPLAPGASASLALPLRGGEAGTLALTLRGLPDAAAAPVPPAPERP